MHKISIQTLLIMVMGFVLFAVFVPMSFVVLNENSEINLLQKEKAGAVLIPQIQGINILLAEHRGIANRYLNGNLTVQPKLEELETQILHELVNNIEQCNTQLFEPSCKKLRGLQTNWLTLKNSYSTLTISQSFTQHSLLISQVLEFLTDIADSSNLSLDNQLSTYYLMNTMVDTLPHLIEHVGQLRGFSSGLLAKPHTLDSTEKMEVIRLLHAVQLSMQTVNLQTKKVFSFLPQFEMEQRQKLSESNLKIDAFLTDIEQLIKTNPQKITLKIDDEQHFNQASNVIYQIVDFYLPVVDALNEELSKRIDSLRVRQFYILGGSLLFALLLISFMFYFKKRLGVLNHAVTCFEQVSAENYDYAIKITYHDEIGQLLEALTVMRNQLASHVQELKLSISRLIQAQRIAQLGDWEWDMQTDELHCSVETYRILDINESVSVWNLERFLNRIKVTDRDNVAATFKHAQKSAGNYDVEYQTHCENGTKKTIHQRIESHVNEQGKIVRLVGTIQDVTIQREMEAKIRLAAEVFDNVGEGIVVTDEKNKVILINKVFSQITGYSPKEVIGNNPNFLSSGKHTTDFYHSMWEKISSTGMWKGEVWNQRKDGSLYPEILTITTMRNHQGEIINHIGIFSDITVQKQAAEQIEYLANYDFLTGLMNRHALEFAVKQALAQTKRHQKLLALLFIDLDGFKAVNDTLGHDVGDTVLKTSAENLKNTIRECDITARLGGDEFVVVLTNLSDTKSIIPIADKIVLALNQTLSNETQTLYVSPSIGISVYSDDCDDYEKLLTQADKAMYAAKTKGKNNYQFAL